MISDATTFVSGAVDAIATLLSPTATEGTAAVGWAALLAVACAGGVVGLGVSLVRKFTSRK